MFSFFWTLCQSLQNTKQPQHERQMFPDKNKQEQAERRIQHATNRPAARLK